MKNYSPYYGDIIIDEKHHPIIIYIVGKVGSKTVVESLFNVEEIPYSVYHVHQLAPQAKSANEVVISNSVFRSTQAIESFNVKLSDFIYDNYDNYQWKVITLVRDPFAIALSMFFEFIDAGVIDSSYPELVKNGNLIATFEEFSDVFHTSCFKHIMYVEKWFDIELNNVFGINIFDYPFDHEKGYSIISKGNVDLLIMRAENLNKSFKNAIRDFIGIEDIKIINDNVGDDKYYSNVYRFIKDKFKLKEAYASDIYDSDKISKLVRHFYTDIEIKNFISKWTEKKSITDEDYTRYDIDKENIFKQINEMLQMKKKHHLKLKLNNSTTG